MKILQKIFSLFILSNIVFLLISWVLFRNLYLPSLFLLLLLFCFFIPSWIMLRHFFKDFDKLIFRTEEMAAGSLSRRCKIARNDEVGQMANVLNNLGESIRARLEKNLHKEKEIKKAKSDFVALASHQLRTPLSIVKWYIDFILGGDAGKINKDQQKYLKEVYMANERLIELVNNLLDVSRIDVGTFSIDPEPSNIIKLADDAIRKIRSEATEKHIAIETEYDSLPVINLDTRLMGIVFVNLLANAVKYTPENGRIKVVIKKTETSAFIKIADTGAGIPRNQQDKIFTKLFRADNVRKIESVGTGLGLYIVKAVIEKSGGKIWFESPSMDLLLEDEQKYLSMDQEHPGTTFFITIPLKGMRERKGTKKLTGLSH